MIPASFPDLDELIRQNRSFAIFRLPGEAIPHLVMQTEGEPDTVTTVEALNGRTGFVVAPFQVSAQYPLVIIRPDRIQNLSPIEIAGSDIPKAIGSSVSKEKEIYQEVFSHFMEPLTSRQIDKLVLSRHHKHPRPDKFSPAASFLKACRNYTRSYVYLTHTPLTGTWLGSTPEILLSGEGTQWQTVALAGTMPLLHGRLPSGWNEKNKEEQQIVSSYIRKQLHAFGILPNESSPYSVRAALLAHLKTDFRFKLPDNSRLGSLLQMLHPTPAIAGIPRNEAIEFICANERYDRAYYTGFLGMLEPAGKSDLYVNLRCMQIHSSYLTLYAGSGLLPGSTLEEEWQETESKMGTMMELIDHHIN